jgi:hypothetical protein
VTGNSRRTDTPTRSFSARAGGRKGATQRLSWCLPCRPSSRERKEKNQSRASWIFRCLFSNTLILNLGCKDLELLFAGRYKTVRLFIRCVLMKNWCSSKQASSSPCNNSNSLSLSPLLPWLLLFRRSLLNWVFAGALFTQPLLPSDTYTVLFSLFVFLCVGERNSQLGKWGSVHMKTGNVELDRQELRSFTE